MPETLTQFESSLSARLQEKGITNEQALVIAILSVRGFVRPRDDLIAALSHYPGLDGHGQMTSTFDQLLDKGWICSEESYGIYLCGPAPDIRDKIADLLQDDTISDKIHNEQTLSDKRVTIMPMRDGQAFQTFLDRMQNAQSSIHLIMLATKLDEVNILPILRERADSGVKVRILYASPSVVSFVRGNNLKQKAKERLNTWIFYSKKYKFDLRVSNDKNDFLLATSASFDGKILRSSAYDFDQERSKAGVLLECASPENKTLNLVAAFDRNFLHTWMRAKPMSSKWDWCKWILKRSWRYIPVLIFGIVATFAESNSVIFSVSASICASFIAAEIVEIVKSRAKKLGEA